MIHFHQVSITNITSQRTRENAIRLGGLQSRTLYTAMIKSVMGDEVSDMETDVTFKTRKFIDFLLFSYHESKTRSFRFSKDRLLG